MSTIKETRAALVAWLASGVSVDVVLFTGSRDWPRPSLIHDVLGLLPDSAVLRHGAARGADTQADTSWRLHGRERVDRHPVSPEQWAAFPGRAGFMRNDRMVLLGASCCVACIWRGSSGATHCADHAEEFGIPTFRFELPEQE